MHTLHTGTIQAFTTHLDSDHRPLGALLISTHVDCAIGTRGELLYCLIALCEVGRTRSIRPLQPIRPTAGQFQQGRFTSIFVYINVINKLDVAGINPSSAIIRSRFLQHPVCVGPPAPGGLVKPKDGVKNNKKPSASRRSD